MGTMRLPNLSLTENLMYARCDEAKEDLAALRQESLIVGLSEVNRERLLTLLTHISAAYAGTCPGKKKAPQCVECPLQVVARLASRSPRLDIVSVVLANW